MITELEQSLADSAEQNMQLQAALRRFLAWRGPLVQAIAHAETQVHRPRHPGRWEQLPARTCDVASGLHESLHE